MAITREELTTLGIVASMEATPPLPHMSLSSEEFELLHATFGIENGWSKTLHVEIGKGITYIANYNEGETTIDLIFKAQADCFAHPMTITVTTSKEPGEYDHGDYCPYAWTWEEDEHGEPFYRDDAGDIHYEADCYCEWIETSLKVFALDENLDLAPAAEYVRQLLDGELWFTAYEKPEPMAIEGLAGHTIVGVTLNPQWDSGNGEYIYDPIITLDNGVKVAFAVQEGSDGDHGIAPCIFPPSKEISHD